MIIIFKPCMLVNWKGAGERTTISLATAVQTDFSPPTIQIFQSPHSQLLPSYWQIQDIQDM